MGSLSTVKEDIRREDGVKESAEISTFSPTTGFSVSRRKEKPSTAGRAISTVSPIEDSTKEGMLAETSDSQESLLDGVPQEEQRSPMAIGKNIKRGFFIMGLSLER